MKQPLIDRLERKIGRFAPKNLILVIVIGTGAVWLLDYVVFMRTGYGIMQWLYFDRDAILRGEVWRLVTFLFVPETSSLFWIAFSLYFYWLIGTSLENAWGAFRFDAYYLCGVLGSIVGGFLVGYATNTYLNMSLFLAFAILYPNLRVHLFFIIPIKVKWIAILDAVSLVLLLILNGWDGKLMILLSLLNLVLFVWRIPFNSLRAWRRRRQWKKQTQRPNEDDYPFDL